MKKGLSQTAIICIVLIPWLSNCRGDNSSIINSMFLTETGGALGVPNQQATKTMQAAESTKESLETTAKDLELTPVNTKTDEERLSYMSLSADGNILVIASGVEEYSYNPKTLTQEAKHVFSDLAYQWALSPDGTILAYASESRPGSKISFMDTTNGTIVKVIETDYYRLWSLRFSRDGKWLASGGSNSISIWSVADGTLQKVLVTGKITSEFKAVSLDFSPDRNQLAVGSANSDTQIWDLVNCKLLANYSIHTKIFPYVGVYEIKYSPDGSRIASMAADNTFALWNPTTGQVYWKMKEDRFTEFEFTPNKPTIAVAYDSEYGAKLDFVDINSGETISYKYKISPSLNDSIDWMAFTPTGGYIYILELYYRHIYVFSTELEIAILFTQIP